MDNRKEKRKIYPIIKTLRAILAAQTVQYPESPFISNVPMKASSNPMIHEKDRPSVEIDPNFL